MNYAELANTGVLEQPVYEPGKPIESVAREFGLAPEAIAKLAIDNARQIDALTSRVKELEGEAQTMRALHHGGNRFAKVEVSLENFKKQFDALNKKVEKIDKDVTTNYNLAETASTNVRGCHNAIDALEKEIKALKKK